MPVSEHTNKGSGIFIKSQNKGLTPSSSDPAKVDRSPAKQQAEEKISRDVIFDNIVKDLPKIIKGLDTYNGEVRSTPRQYIKMLNSKKKLSKQEKQLNMLKGFKYVSKYVENN